MRLKKMIVPALVAGLFGLSIIGIPLESAAADAPRDITILGPRTATATNNPPPVVEMAAETEPVESSAPQPVAPVGSVVAWLGNLPNTPPLPQGWVECNGQILQEPKSPYNGTTIPNLNGVGTNSQQRFLRGSTTSGATGGAIDHTHGLTLMERADKHQVNVQGRNPAPHLPPYYDVVWIMRVF